MPGGAGSSAPPAFPPPAAFACKIAFSASILAASAGFGAEGSMRGRMADDRSAGLTPRALANWRICDSTSPPRACPAPAPVLVYSKVSPDTTVNAEFGHRYLTLPRDAFAPTFAAAEKAASPGLVAGARWPVMRFQYPPAAAAQTVNLQA